MSVAKKRKSDEKAWAGTQKEEGETMGPTKEEGRYSILNSIPSKNSCLCVQGKRHVVRRKVTIRIRKQKGPLRFYYDLEMGCLTHRRGEPRNFRGGGGGLSEEKKRGERGYTKAPTSSLLLGRGNIRAEGEKKSSVIYCERKRIVSQTSDWNGKRRNVE